MVALARALAAVLGRRIKIHAGPSSFGGLSCTANVSRGYRWVTSRRGFGGCYLPYVPYQVEWRICRVDIFFVISGFLISTLILGSLENNSFSFANFYGRRIRRIFPALIVVLVSCYSFSWLTLLADEYSQLGKHIAAGAGFVANLVLWNESGYFNVAAEAKPLLHLWSLVVEEQFYIAWRLRKLAFGDCSRAVCSPMRATAFSSR